MPERTTKRVAAGAAMETFGKAWREPRETSATVTRVARLAVALGALALLVCGGLASAILAAGPVPAGAATATAATTTAATPTLTSTAPSVLAFTGHGWGHGLGMSQWGAYGYAKHGWTYDKILTHYYPLTTLGKAPVATVRVLLAQEAKATLSSDGPWTVTAGGAKTRLDPGPLALGAKLAIGGKPMIGPLTFASKRPISLDGHAYRGTVV